MAAGALGSSISGGGPSVFAWFSDRDAAAAAAAPMQAAFAGVSLESDVFISAVDGPKASVIG